MTAMITEHHRGTLKIVLGQVGDPVSSSGSVFFFVLLGFIGLATVMFGAARAASRCRYCRGRGEIRNLWGGLQVCPECWGTGGR